MKARWCANIEVFPKTIPGAAWGPQKERMDAGVYFPLFIVLFDKQSKKRAIYYLPADLQSSDMFKPRNLLKETARRAGWQGFNIDLKDAADLLARVV